MLIRILRDFLRPYRGLLVVLVLLQLAGTIASLYLPSLNGKIIDDGVAKGDTDYILRTGGWMLAVSFAQIIATVAATYLGARSAAGPESRTQTRRSSLSYQDGSYNTSVS